MTIRLFHFMSAKHALNALEEQAIKVSNFDDLNDPFELHAAGSEDKTTRDFLERFRDKYSENYRMICCSKSWDSPVVWGHYADSHRGIALVLDANCHVTDVDYVSDRSLIGKIDLNAEPFLPELDSIDLLSTKYEEWRYEDEARIFLKPEGINKYGGLEFVDFKDMDIEISGLILGPLNKTKETDIAKKIPSGKSVWYTKARLAFQSYRVISDKSKSNVVVNSTNAEREFKS